MLGLGLHKFITGLTETEIIGHRLSCTWSQ